MSIEVNLNLNINLNLASSFSFSGPAPSADPLQEFDSGDFFASNFELRFLLRFFFDFGFILAPILTSKIDLGAHFSQLRFPIEFLSVSRIDVVAFLPQKRVS